MAMKGMFLAAVVASLLVGCAPLPAVDYNQNIRNIGQNIRNITDKQESDTLATRAAYVRANPGKLFNNAVQDGVIVVGMDYDQVIAAGYTCDVKVTSADGTVQQCTNDMLQAKLDAIAADDPDSSPKAPPYYVAFNSDEKVTLVQNP